MKKTQKIILVLCSLFLILGILFPSKVVNAEESEEFVGIAAGCHIKGDEKWQWPMHNWNRINGCYEHRSYDKNGKLIEVHSGIDIVRTWDVLQTAPVTAAQTGKILRIENTCTKTADGSCSHCTRGNSVTILTICENGDRYVAQYMHMAPNTIPSSLKVGATVNKGEKLGIAGNSGESRGTHLHFQINKFPAGDATQEKDMLNIIVKNQDNGLKMYAVDPLDMMDLSTIVNGNKLTVLKDTIKGSCCDNYVKKHLNAASDTESPKISDVKIDSEDSNGYTISCTITDNTGLSLVQFPTWTFKNDQDDLANPWPTYTAKDGNTFYFRVNYSDHNNERGYYATHIYAYDAYGNMSKFCLDVLTEAITYNANGGNGAPAAQSKIMKTDLSESGENVTLSSYKPTRENYIFIAWNTMADGTGGSYYAAGAVYKKNEAVTLYALWKKADVMVSTLTFGKNEMELIEGKQEKITVKIGPDDATNKTLKWSSNNLAVATVDNNGNVTAVKAGTAVITAAATDNSGKSASCTVTVKAATIAVTGITLNKSTTTLTEGGSESLTATVSPSNATEKSVKWSSSDTSVAKVDNSGKVTALKAGTATITVTAGDGSGKSASCTVTVKAAVVAVTGITLNKSTMTLTEGGSDSLTATVSPSNATEKSVKWSSSDTSVAKVDNSGKVTALKAGTATITATAGDGSGKSASCTVAVAKKENPPKKEDPTPANGWYYKDGKAYWYESSERQGTMNDPKGVLGDGTVRGREIYDPSSDGWYWLDSIYEGAKACSKEVWMPYIYQNEKGFDDAEIAANAANSGDMAAQVTKAIKEGSGKWVRYDANGKMYKGWYTVEGADAQIYPDQAGNTYYYDPKTGLMAKGSVTIDGKTYQFDEVTGVLVK